MQISSMQNPDTHRAESIFLMPKIKEIIEDKIKKVRLNFKSGFFNKFKAEK